MERNNYEQMTLPVLKNLAREEDYHVIQGLENLS